MNITIQKDTGIPKYKQIIASVEHAIVNGDYKRGDKLPSINKLKLKFSLSRDTVLIAYSDLKSRGIIQAIPGKGYYIRTESVNISKKVFILFDEFNSFKEDLYNSFLEHLGEHIEVEIFFHHFNYEIFSKLIYDNIGRYNSYIIMPANLKETDLVISALPSDSVYILDQTHIELSKYPAIYQNFEKDIFSSLQKGRELLDNYNKLLLLFNDQKQPIGMLNGFKRYCEHSNKAYDVISSLENRELEKGEVYIIPDDRNLIKIIKKLKETNLKVVRDIGIISYNDTQLKEIVLDGITTISTDFKIMGKQLAEMVLNNRKINIENSNNLIIRNSL